MRLGVFGGTFDPPHIGHLAIAEQARAQLALDRVLFVPAGHPPHKTPEDVAPPDIRRQMVEAAIGDNAAFAVCDFELRRSGPSFTADTLAALRAAHPADELVCLIGSDSAVQLHTWHDPPRLYGLATFAVLMRPGWPREALDAWLAAQPAGARPRFHIVDVPLLAIASRDLRASVGAGRSIRYLVPESVLRIIARHGLYREGSADAAVR